MRYSNLKTHSGKTRNSLNGTSVAFLDNVPEEIFNGRDVSTTNLARIKRSYRGNENSVVCIQFLSTDNLKCNELDLE